MYVLFFKTVTGKAASRYFNCYEGSLSSSYVMTKNWVNTSDRLGLRFYRKLQHTFILQVSLLELNFLPTSGSALTKQQLILAREYWWQVRLMDNITKLSNISLINIFVVSVFQVMSLKLGPCGVSSRRTSHPLRDTWPSLNATTLITSNVTFFVFHVY